MDREKTTHMTTRVPQRIYEILRTDAKVQNKTVSSLVLSILTKYAEWDRFTGKFGFSQIPHSVYRHLLETVDEQSYMQAPIERSYLLEMVRFWHKRVDPSAVVEFLERYSRYAGTYRCDVEQKNGIYFLTLEHELGRKYSIILKRNLEEGIRMALGITPKVEITSSSLFFTLSDQISKAKSADI